jgi:Domain of unknown function (DUF3127)
MGFETSGKLHAVSDTKQVTERFRKREFVIELADNPRFPQFVQFELTGDRCEHLDGFEVGEQVRVEFSLRGREWKSPRGETKYFNSLDVWTVERMKDEGGSRRLSDDDEPPPPSDDDVPF